MTQLGMTFRLTLDLFGNETEVSGHHKKEQQRLIVPLSPKAMLSNLRVPPALFLSAKG